MKLYTEEQMKEAFTNGFLTAMNYDGGCNDHFNDYIKSATPIELPSDDEIEDIACKRLVFDEISWIKGAKWVADKIKNQKR